MSARSRSGLLSHARTPFRPCSCRGVPLPPATVVCPCRLSVSWVPATRCSARRRASAPPQAPNTTAARTALGTRAWRGPALCAGRHSTSSTLVALANATHTPIHTHLAATRMARASPGWLPLLPCLLYRMQVPRRGQALPTSLLCAHTAVLHTPTVFECTACAPCSCHFVHREILCTESHRPSCQAAAWFCRAQRTQDTCARWPTRTRTPLVLSEPVASCCAASQHELRRAACQP